MERVEKGDLHWKRMLKLKQRKVENQEIEREKYRQQIKIVNNNTEARSSIKFLMFYCLNQFLNAMHEFCR